jgi:hypothetical protein
MFSEKDMLSDSSNKIFNPAAPITQSPLVKGVNATTVKILTKSP